MSSIYRLLRSTKLALWLMVAITSYVLAAVYLERWFGDLYRKWWFVLMLALLVVNLTTCTMHRFGNYLKLGRSKWQPSRYNLSFTASRGEDLSEPLRQCLAERGYIVSSLAEGYRAEKNGKGWMGSLVFHFGMVVVLLGFAWSLLFGLEGALILTLGSTKTVPQELINTKTGLFYRGKVNIEATMQSFEPKAKDGVNTQLKSTLGFKVGNKQTTQSIDINQPGEVGNVYVRTYKFGMAPYLRLDKGGTTVLENYVILGKTVGNVDSDWISIGPDNILIESNRDVSNKSDYQGKPTKVRFSIYTSSGKQTSGVIPLNQKVQIGDYQVSFIDSTPWVYYDVSYDPGEELIFLGSALIVFGLALRVISTSKKVAFKITPEYPQVLQVALQTDYFSALFQQEITEMINQIGGNLNADE